MTKKIASHLILGEKIHWLSETELTCIDDYAGLEDPLTSDAEQFDKLVKTIQKRSCPRLCPVVQGTLKI